MMGTIGNKSYYAMYDELISDIIEEYGTLANRTIARILCNRYPEIFYNIDMARDAVRWRRGAKGEKSRKNG
jgi:hypothetical protein